MSEIEEKPCLKAKHCPFCGSVPNYRASKYGVHFIECEAKCGVRPCVHSMVSLAAALRRWNKRAPSRSAPDTNAGESE